MKSAIIATAYAAIAMVASSLVAAQEEEVNYNTTTMTNMSFTNPTSGAQWSYSDQETIMWTPPAVSDPQNISLLIVNVYNYSMLPAYPTPLALNIFANQSSFSLANVSIPIGDGYVILMADIYNSSNIYAQGGIFSVSTSESTDAVGSGFSIASSTTIIAGAPAGGVPTISSGVMPIAEGTVTPTPLRMVRHRRSSEQERH